MYMNKIFYSVIFVLITLATAGHANAAPLSENAARAIANDFFGLPAPAVTPRLAHKAPRTTKSGVATSVPAYYVFNNEANGGWVVVAGDDRARAILAYSDEGAFDPHSLGEGAQALLVLYAQAIGSIDEATTTTTTASQPQGVSLLAINKSDIAPMLTCRWGQDAPFYFQCPKSGSNYTVTGCAATALAQVMYYFKWPTTAKAIPAYTPDDRDLKGTTIASLPSTTFNWSAMKDYYASTETSTTSAANAAVAKLMRYCGQALTMNYGVDASGATTNPIPLYTYFGYNGGVTVKGRTEYTAASWQDMIYTELAAGRPVILMANKTTGGHAFVCDGYDKAKALFHINWGWYGYQDGYFALDVLNPDGGGTGSIDGNDGYVVDLRAIVGIQPLRTGSNTDYGDVLSFFPIYSSNVTESSPGVTATSVSRSSTNTNFSIVIQGSFWNKSNFEGNYDIAWGLFNNITDETPVSITHFASNRNIQASYYTTYRTSITFGSGKSSGTYYFKALSRRYGSSTWKPIVGAAENYVKATISGNTVTLTPYSAHKAGFQIQNPSFEGERKVGHNMALKFNASTAAANDYHIVYLFVDGKLAGANSVVTTSSYKVGRVHFTPSSSGTKTVKLTDDVNGNNVLYTGTVTIEASPAASLTITPTVANISAGTLNGTVAGVTAKVKNNGTSAYSDLIIFRLFSNTDGGTRFTATNFSKSVKVSVGSGTTYNTQCSFSDLTPGVRYIVTANYYSNGKLVSGGQSSAFLVAQNYDVNADGQINVGDVSTVYAVILGTDLTYRSKADVNGDGQINVGDISTLYDAILKK